MIAIGSTPTSCAAVSRRPATAAGSAAPASRVRPRRSLTPHAHRRQRRIAHIQHAQDRRARRRHALHRWPGCIHRRIAQQRQRGRSGHRQCAVRALHRSAAHIQRRSQPAVHAQRRASRRRAHDIHDRVHRAHFVEVHLLDGNGMNRGFRLAQQLKGAADARCFTASDSGAASIIPRIADSERCGAWLCSCDGSCVFDARVMRARACVSAVRGMRVLMPARAVPCRDVCGVSRSAPASAHPPWLPASPPRLTLRISSRAPTFSAAAVSASAEGHACIDQRAQQHVAADAGKTLQISNSHRS